MQLEQGMQNAPASFGAVCHGPVIIDTAAAAFSGCIARTNNTAELSAVPQMLARACRYQRDKRDSARRGRQPPPPPLTLIFCYDSQYTHDTGVADAASPLPRRNCTIVALCRRLLADAAQLGIAVAWVKVRGHSTANPADMTVVGNNRADKAADRGQEGQDLRRDRDRHVHAAGAGTLKRATAAKMDALFPSIMLIS